MTSSEREIRDLLGGLVGPEIAGDVSEDDQIFEQGIIDSMHLVELVGALESRYGFKVAGDELSPDNFASVRAMASYLDRKTAR
jgi:methoxymalonate biosynthesis acyl carrier protein